MPLLLAKPFISPNLTGSGLSELLLARVKKVGVGEKVLTAAAEVILPVVPLPLGLLAPSSNQVELPGAPLYLATLTVAGLPIYTPLPQGLLAVQYKVTLTFEEPVVRSSCQCSHALT